MDLPPGWSAFQVPDGRTYYYCEATNKSQWQKPFCGTTQVVKRADARLLDAGAAVDVQSLLNKVRSDYGPASVYSAWEKPRLYSEQARAVEAFRIQAGEDAANILEVLQARHQPCNFDRISSEGPFCVCWEDKWSSSEAGTRDKDGEVMIDKLGQILESKGIVFEDPYFTGSKHSLFVDPAQADKNKNAGTSERFDEDAFLAGRDVDATIQWKRAKDICNPNERAVVFSGTVSPNDVQQGGLGNCYYIAAVAACASSADDILINDLIVEDYGDSVGLYGVKFFFSGKWITVAVDDRFPCEYKLGQWRPIFAAPKKNSEDATGEKEIWPLLFEKAFSKLHGSYECTDAGMSEDALHYLTGGLKHVISLSQADSANQFEELRSAFSAKAGSEKFVACGCRGKNEGFTPASLKAVGLISGHAYSVSSAMQTSSGLRFVQVRNPWGSTEWKGRFSDKSPDWTDALKKELHATVEEDGSFFMLWEDFVQYYGRCKIVDPTCFNTLSEDAYARIDGAAGSWVAGKTAGGRLGPDTFMFNPKIELTGHGGPAWITAYQPDTRHTCIAPIEAELGTPMLDVFVYFGRVGARPEVIMELYGGVEGDRFASKQVTMEPNVKYHIVVTAKSAGIEGAFSVTACGKGVSLQACPYEAPPPAIAAAMMKREGRQK